jgi:Tol biopolymer transport system component
MSRLRLTLAALLLAALVWATRAEGPATQGAPAPRSNGIHAGEPFASLEQLTFGGENAEAYFSFEGDRIVFQSTRDGYPCDQIYVMRLPPREPPRRISTGTGKTTCGFFFPGGAQLLYASTHLAGPACPPRPDFSKGYVWALDPGFDIFKADADGGRLTRLTDTFGYDAEATVGADGRIVFTSVRDGDLELYLMGAAGESPVRLTHQPGYDGGAFFAPDGKSIVWRAGRPAAGPELDDYRALLARHQVRPGALELFVMDSDGSNARQLTRLGGANFAPYFHPDGRRVIFASNHLDPQSRNFDLFMIGIDGTGLVRLTTFEGFDGFPMFDRSGRRLLFASNRLGKVRGETNIFLAELW